MSGKIVYNNLLQNILFKHFIYQHFIQVFSQFDETSYIGHRLEHTEKTSNRWLNRHIRQIEQNRYQ